MDGGNRRLEDEAITSTITWPDLWVLERTGLMRAYRQLETCSAPDRDLGLQPFLPVHTVACSHDTLIHPGLSLGSDDGGVSRWKNGNGGIGDVNRKMPASRLTKSLTSAFVLAAASREQTCSR